MATSPTVTSPRMYRRPGGTAVNTSIDMVTIVSAAIGYRTVSVECRLFRRFSTNTSCSAVTHANRNSEEAMTAPSRSCRKADSLPLVVRSTHTTPTATGSARNPISAADGTGGSTPRTSS